MFTLVMRLVQIRERVRTQGWSSFLHEAIYFSRKALVVEKRLAEARDRADLLARSQIAFIEITPQALQDRRYRFCVHSRRLKALHYTKRGFGGYALVRGETIIGDIWYFPRGTA